MISNFKLFTELAAFMGRDFSCGTCQNFEEEHRLCVAAVLLKGVTSSGIYFLCHSTFVFLTIPQLQVVSDLL